MKSKISSKNEMLLIFWIIGHTHDLITWYDFHNDRTGLSPVLGCENITVKYPMTGRVKDIIIYDLS